MFSFHSPFVIVVLCAASCACVSGCGKSYGWSVLGLNESNCRVEQLRCDGRVFIVVVANDSTGTSSGEGNGSFHGEFVTPDDRKIAWSCNARDSTSASLTIDGQNFDLRDGAVFLVRTNGPLAKVQQLSVDVSKIQNPLPPDRPLQAWGNWESGIAEFVKTASARQLAAGPGTPNQPVVEKPQVNNADSPSFTNSEPKVAPGPPTVGPKGNVPHRDQFNFSLNPTGIGAVTGNVHLYHVNHLNRPAGSDDEPFFVVWTDATAYSSAAGIEVTRGGKDKKANDPTEHSYHVNLTLLYAGKANELERETKCSFDIKVLDEKGRIEDGQKCQFQIDGKTFDVARGTLVLVAGKEGDVRVKLLSRSSLPRDLKEVIVLGKADADIKAFFPDIQTLPIFSEGAKGK